MSEIDAKIIEIIEDNGVLNSMEICRVINHQSRSKCNSEVGWKIIDGKKVNRSMMDVCKDCKIHYFTILKKLHKLESDKIIKKKKRWFLDNNRSGKRIDLFSFWYIDEQAYKDKILNQTLEGYGIL